MLEAVRRGAYEHEWAPVSSSWKGRTAVFQVSRDALRVGGVRVNLCAADQQRAADVIGGMLLTVRVADLAYLQAPVKVPPFPRPITSSVAAMREHSDRIDAFVAKSGAPAGLLTATVGKHWLIDRRISATRAMNYGWHFFGRGARGIRGYPLPSDPRAKVGRDQVLVIQPDATAHDPFHSDYSQTASFMSTVCEVDGVQMAVEDLLRDPDLAFLASHHGRSDVVRQPGVERYDGPVVLPEVVLQA